MIFFAAVLVVIHRRGSIRLRQFAPVVIPDDDFDVFLPAQVVPQPRVAVSVRVGLPLHAHTAMRRAASQCAFADIIVRIADGIAVCIHAAGVNRGHHMQQIAAVEADGLIAVQVARPETARPAAQQKLAAGRLVDGRIAAADRARGAEQRGQQPALLVEIQPLGHLIHNDAVCLVRRDGADSAGFHPALFQLVPVVIGFDFCPAILLVEHLDGDRRAIKKAAALVIRLALAVRRIRKINLLLLIRAQDGDVRSEPRPGRFFILRVEFAEPRRLNGFLGRFQIFLYFGLRGGLSLGRRVRANVFELFVHGFLGFPVRRAGLLQAAGFLELLDGFHGRLAQLAAAVAVVIAQLLQVLLQRDDLRTGRTHAQLPADQPFL